MKNRVLSTIWSVIVLTLSLQASAEMPPYLRALIRDGQDFKVESHGRNYAPFETTLPKEFRPENKPTMTIESYWVNESDWYKFEDAELSPDMRSRFTRTYQGKKQVRLLVHPQTAKFYEPLLRSAQRSDSFLATPLASGRTMVVWKKGFESRAFLAKLSLDAKIGTTWRMVWVGEVVRSIGVNSVLKAAKKTLPEGFKYFPEVFGIAPTGTGVGGMIIREIPQELKDGKDTYHTLMSLFESTDGKTPPAFVEMIRKSGLTPREFFKTHLTEPFVDQWFEMTLKQGINMEPHSQNLLMGIGPDGLPNKKFMHWDFGGFSIDINHRQKYGMPMPKELPRILGSDIDFEQGEVKMRYRSLQRHFNNGVMYNIDKRIPQWVSSGWLTTSEWSAKQVELDFFEAVKKQFNEKTGHLPEHMDDLTLIGEDIERARIGMSFTAMAPPPIDCPTGGFFSKIRQLFGTRSKP